MSTFTAPRTGTMSQEYAPGTLAANARNVAGFLVCRDLLDMHLANPDFKIQHSIERLFVKGAEVAQAWTEDQIRMAEGVE